MGLLFCLEAMWESSKETKRGLRGADYKLVVGLNRSWGRDWTRQLKGMDQAPGQTR